MVDAIEWMLGDLFGHTFKFTRYERAYFDHYLSRQKVGFIPIDGAIVTWKTVRDRVRIQITA